MEHYNIPNVITIKLTSHSLSVKSLIVETTFSSKYLEVFFAHSYKIPLQVKLFA